MAESFQRTTTMAAAAAAGDGGVKNVGKLDL